MRHDQLSRRHILSVCVCVCLLSIDNRCHLSLPLYCLIVPVQHARTHFVFGPFLMNGLVCTTCINYISQTTQNYMEYILPLLLLIGYYMNLQLCANIILSIKKSFTFLNHIPLEKTKRFMGTSGSYYTA